MPGLAANSPGFDNSYRRLGERYSADCRATAVQAPAWLAWNSTLAGEMDWPAHWCGTDECLQALAGNAVLAGSEPIAAVYAGHQFGSYNPQLGDGRALLLGEWVNSSGQRYDVQLKGAGPTPFSRGGDGRSPVGPVVREFLLSESMHALGVPSTRALAAVATGESVYRQYREPGAVLTRVAKSHVRVGTVQYFAMSRGGDGLAELVDYITRRHYAEALDSADHNSAARVLLEETAKRLATLVAYWQGLGFIHGVLNTDNTLLSGETIDYGPCAFMDSYDPKKVFSSIDTQGRYAYANQPGIIHWNLSVLAQCLLPLIDDNDDAALALAQGVVDRFPDWYADAHAGVIAAKFGLEAIHTTDRALVDNFFQILTDAQLDFSLAFRWLTELAAGELEHSPLPEVFAPSEALTDWLPQWQARRARDRACAAYTLDRMRAANPAVIPRNHWVAQAITAAEAGDTSLMQRLYQRWQTPWHWQSGDTELAAAPQPEQVVQRTFCGT